MDNPITHSNDTERNNDNNSNSNNENNGNPLNRMTLGEVMDGLLNFYQKMIKKKMIMKK